jgi:hypothetical protein
MFHQTILSELPDVFIRELFKYLNQVTMVMLGRTCRKFHNLIGTVEYMHFGGIHSMHIYENSAIGFIREMDSEEYVDGGPEVPPLYSFGNWRHDPKNLPVVPCGEYNETENFVVSWPFMYKYGWNNCIYDLRTHTLFLENTQEDDIDDFIDYKFDELFPGRIEDIIITAFDSVYRIFGEVLTISNFKTGTTLKINIGTLLGNFAEITNFLIDEKNGTIFIMTGRANGDVYVL